MDRMNITVEIQSVGPKRTNVRSSMYVASLISATKDKFNLDGNYVLVRKGERQPLSPEMPLDQAGISDGNVLVCARVVQASRTKDAIQSGVREPISKQFKRVYLQEERQLVEYDMAWQPAVIGRRDRRDPSNNKLLVVDLEGFEEAPTVSRHHACITEKDGSFFVEGISENNPTYLGDTRLKPGIKVSLPVGSRIRVGRVTLTFYVIS